MSGWVRRSWTSGRLLLIAPLLLLTTLLCWAFSSPVGSSADEDYHLVSIWCATGSPAACVPDPDGVGAEVPAALLDASCFAFDSTISGACQRTIDFRGPVDTSTDRGNFFGGYPPIFYGTMSRFVGPDIQASVLVMRVVLSLLFTALATALFVALPRDRRRTLIWAWVVTTVPLGLFVVTSINPSAWVVAGVGFGWLALAGFLESRGARKVALGIIFTLSVVMAAGARGDGALYMVLAILATFVLQVRRSRRFARDMILPAIAIVFCVLIFRVSRPTEAITQGIPSGGGSGGAAVADSVLARVLPTAFDIPSLWMGVFGKGWGLGWLDTSMPAVVWFASLGCFVGAGAVAAARSDLRKALVLGAGAVVLLVFPTAVLVAAGEPVGANLQPRYLLPLVVLFAGVLFWVPRGRDIRFGRAQRGLVIGALAVAQAVALFLELARYVSGFDDLGPNLDARIEWWWGGGVSPMGVWVLGSLSYAVLIALLLGRATGDGATQLRAGDRRDEMVAR